MKSTHNHGRTTLVGQGSLERNASGRAAFGNVLARAKRELLKEHADSAGEHLHVLRLALNEAEALAWSTGVPQLVFPTLAGEKVQQALAWHRRQRAVRRAGLELSFAE
jgi:hypothetical protein